MYDDDELTPLDIDADLESPLDQLGPPNQETEPPQYDPEVMLPLLESPETQQRMLAARACCEVMVRV